MMTAPVKQIVERPYAGGFNASGVFGRLPFAVDAQTGRPSGPSIPSSTDPDRTDDGSD